MNKTTFYISKMDCPSEENLIRMKLDEVENVIHLEFDIPKRKLTVFHDNSEEKIEDALHQLNLGTEKISTEKSNTSEFDKNSNQTSLLWTVLFINLIFFFIEVLFGFLSKSIGLVADSLDMLADSFVYGLSLLAVGGTVVRKKKIAKVAGYFQISLAIIGFIEVVRRFNQSQGVPDFSTMIIVSIFALVANSLCLYLLQKSNSKEEAHMKASMIFTSNDVIINIGVIIAGILVSIFQSKIPDLIIGTIVFILVIKGALRILNLSK